TLTITLTSSFPFPFSFPLKFAVQKERNPKNNVTFAPRKISVACATKVFPPRNSEFQHRSQLCFHQKASARKNVRKLQTQKAAAISQPAIGWQHWEKAKTARTTPKKNATNKTKYLKYGRKNNT
ncbi:MAG: hypothetical protein MJZ96_08935, partial [Paludibacteraceae bacterium]|nr:hypothetical protein [Paludibacteraceae bacterium]